MSTYLPKDSGPGSAYSEGGGLYALGELVLFSYTTLVEFMNLIMIFSLLSRID